MQAHDFLDNPHVIGLGDLVVSKNGGKSASITVDGAPLRLRLGRPGAPCLAVFGFSCWEGEKNQDRCSLDVQADDETLRCIDQLDELLLEALEKNASKYLPAKDAKRVRDMWRPTKKEHAEGKFPPVIRTKATKSSIHVWGEDKTPLTSDAIGPRSELCLLVKVKNLYFQSGSIGCVLECQDALLSSTAAECPWGEAMEE